MAKQEIDLGTGPDTPGADNLYEAFRKMNDNLDDLYFRLDTYTSTYFDIILKDTVLVGALVANNVVFSYWQITESGVPPSTGDANWDANPIDYQITIPDWDPHTYYFWVKNSDIVSEILALDGSSGVTVTPVP